MKMSTNIDDILICIECALINAENPDYLEVQFTNDFIYILISKPEYKHYTLSERQKSIWDLLDFEFGDIISEYSIIIEVFDSNELDQLFKDKYETI